jgi:hypothetical protein
MLLIWQGRSAQKRWKIGDRQVTLAGLQEALKSYWATVANGFPGVVAVDVILIDLTVREGKSST